MRDVMRLKTLLASGLCVLAMSGGLAWAQNAATPAPAVAATLIPADAAWTIAPENLLVIDTNKGRILVGLDPRLAPQSVERIRSLADRGFYDGLAWHRVMAGFMAQTGDPLGTGAGSSDLPDLTAEFQFRRGRDAGFVTVPESGAGTRGIMGFMPLQTQPDAQMMFTADGRTDAMGLFCTGIAGMARSNDPNSANSQFFLTLAESANLNGGYTSFGRVLVGQEVVAALKVGPEAANGRVTDPDVMTRVRTAAAMPDGERPSVRVMDVANPAYAALLAERRTMRGTRFTICDALPPAEQIGG
jgi:cyclophilin family peptidyl-prolyl cis-trans isomerase